MRWPRYDSDKPILSSCSVSLAFATVSFLAVLLVSAAIVAYAYEHPVDGGGYALVVGFIIGPIVFLAGAPWSYLFVSNVHMPAIVQIALMGFGVLLNGLLVGFAIGVVRALRQRTLR
jgi:apolipoprotein N-acyltransferase